MITAIQCRMARTAVGWTIRDFAKEVGVNFNTIVRFEEIGDTRASIMHRMEQAFHRAGVRFGPDGLTVRAPGTPSLELDQAA